MDYLFLAYAHSDCQSELRFCGPFQQLYEVAKSCACQPPTVAILCIKQTLHELYWN